MWYSDIFNGKKNKKEENYSTQENWKRQMIRKIHHQFQISEFIDISKNFRELLAILGETSILISVYPIQKLILMVNFVSNFIVTIAYTLASSFPFYFSQNPFFPPFFYPLPVFQFKLAASEVERGGQTLSLSKNSRARVNLRSSNIDPISDQEFRCINRWRS